jgi:hypothetical protein
MGEDAQRKVAVRCESAITRPLTWLANKNAVAALACGGHSILSPRSVPRPFEAHPHRGEGGVREAAIAPCELSQ